MEGEYLYRIIEITPIDDKRWEYMLYDLYGVESYKMKGKITFEDGCSVSAVIKEWNAGGRVWYTACGDIIESQGRSPVLHDWKIGELFCFGKNTLEDMRVLKK